MKRIIFAAAVAAALVAGAVAGEEPYGQGFDGWKFTQKEWGGGILCTGKRGQTVMEANTNGKRVVKGPDGGVKEGSIHSATITYTGSNGEETVEAVSLGTTKGMVLWVNDTQLTQIAYAKGFTWYVNVGKATKSAKVNFGNSSTKAYQTIMQCVTDNGG